MKLKHVITLGILGIIAAPSLTIAQQRLPGSACQPYRGAAAPFAYLGTFANEATSPGYAWGECPLAIPANTSAGSIDYCFEARVSDNNACGVCTNNGPPSTPSVEMRAVRRGSESVSASSGVYSANGSSTLRRSWSLPGSATPTSMYLQIVLPYCFAVSGACDDYATEVSSLSWYSAQQTSTCVGG